MKRSLTMDRLPLALQKGKITLIIGANGSGKTRLLHTLTGMFDPNETIYYGDTPLWTHRRWSRQLVLNEQALVQFTLASQTTEAQLFAPTLQEEIDHTLRPYALPATERKTRTTEALADVGWDEQWLTRSPQQMSGGERRRAALACLLASPAKWLLLDEPTAGLDATAYDLLEKALVRKQQIGVGIVLVSHESEWAFKFADDILILHPDGTIAHVVKEQLLHHPEWLQAAGMDIPLWLTVAKQLVKRGVSLDTVWNPQRAAEELASRPTFQLQQHIPTFPEPMILKPQTTKTSHDGARVQSPLTLFDPRVMLVAYAIISAVILVQERWLGVAMSALLTIVIVWLGRIPVQRFIGMVKALLYFAILSAVIAGTSYTSGSLSFAIAAASTTLLALSKPILAMVIGIGMTIAMTPLTMRQALEQTFSWKGRVIKPAQPFILLVTLMFRFIPLIMAQWHTFSHYRIMKTKRVNFRLFTLLFDLRLILIPFLLALFKIADDTVYALESRGVTMRPYPQVVPLLQLKIRDGLLFLVTIVISTLLYLYAR